MVGLWESARSSSPIAENKSEGKLTSVQIVNAAVVIKVTTDGQWQKGKVSHELRKTSRTLAPAAVQVGKWKVTGRRGESKVEKLRKKRRAVHTLGT